MGRIFLFMTLCAVFCLGCGGQNCDATLYHRSAHAQTIVIEDVKKVSITETHSVVHNGLGIKEKKENGDVIVLLGHSSGGKSTIISAIKELEPKYREEGSDITGANYIYEFMEKHHEKYGVSKDDWEHLHSVLISKKGNWHIHEIISKEEGTKSEEYSFKPSTSIEDQIRAIKTAAALREPVNEFIAIVCKDIDNIVIDKVGYFHNFVISSEVTMRIDPSRGHVKLRPPKTKVNSNISCISSRSHMHTVHFFLGITSELARG